MKKIFLHEIGQIRQALYQVDLIIIQVQLFQCC